MTESAGEISFECQNLSNHPDARIKLALWYQANRPGTPTVDVQDTAAGMSREVGSVETARFYWWDYLTPLRIALFLLTGLLMLALGVFYVTRPTEAERRKMIAPETQQEETNPTAAEHSDASGND